MTPQTINQIIRIIERDIRNLSAAIDTTFSMENGESERERINTELSKTRDALDEISNLLSDHPDNITPFPDTEADGIVFCGKCGKVK